MALSVTTSCTYKSDSVCMSSCFSDTHRQNHCSIQCYLILQDVTSESFGALLSIVVSYCRQHNGSCLTSCIIVTATEKYHEPTGIAILASLFSVAFLVKFVFAMLILVPLCCRACGYNLCMKTAATIKSHRKALREIVPLFILIVPFLLFICLFVTSLITRQYFVYNVLTFSITGLVCALSFALHIFFVRKKLKKLRDRSTRRPANTYGSIRQFCTNRSTEFTAEGLSESCNTEHIVVSESEIDTRFLLRGAMND